MGIEYDIFKIIYFVNLKINPTTIILLLDQLEYIYMIQ